MATTTISAQGVIDVHSHIITPEFVSTLENEGRLMDEGFPLPKYNVENHLRWMDEAGVETSVLTLAAPQPSSAKVVRQTNETAARIKKEHPGRFMFCAALPLPDVSKAIEEAKFALDVLKADGIKLTTNVDGQYLGAPELDTLFAVLNERKAVVILHPHRPEPVNQQVMQQTPLAMQEYLSETTRAVSNMISRNVLARYNNIKVVVPHCGAYLPLAIPRMKSLTPVMQTNKMVGEIDYEANLRTLYYDLAGAHSPEVIRMLLTITTPDHLLYGSDYPYVAPQVLTQSLARMKQYLSKEPDLAPFKEMILWKNAQSLTQPLSTPLHHREGQGGGSPLLVRIAEIEVYPQYLEEYLTFANEVDRLSIERKPGVVCLFPMQSAEDSTKIRILEIYASDEAYQQHLKTDHFQKYKQGTLHMVKDLKLPTMKPLDPETMKLIFNKQTTDNDMKHELKLTQEWDKVFPLSEKVNHQKVTFKTQYGLTLAADLYTPKDSKGKMAAIAVSGPFGAVKEQCSGLYAMKMAERGFVALAFDPSYTGESSGEPRRTASPDINTEDFMAAVDFLSKQDNVDAEKIGIIGICGWGGIALNAAAADTRIKATVASTMYDMTRVSGNGYFDSEDKEESRHAAREAMAKQRLSDPMAMAGGVVNPLPADAPQFVKDYYDYYKTPRGYHKRSGNSNDGWRVIGTQAYANSRFLYYINEIRSAVLVMHGADAHSRYFGEAAYHYMVDGKAEGYKFVGEPNPNPENKQLLIIPDASHCDLYDGGYEEKAGQGQPKNMIPWDTLAEFFTKSL